MPKGTKSGPPRPVHEQRGPLGALALKAACISVSPTPLTTKLLPGTVATTMTTFAFAVTTTTTTTTTTAQRFGVGLT